MSRLLAYSGVAFLVMSCLLGCPSAWSQEREWTWIDKNCNQKTRADLVGIIAEQSKFGPPINGARIDLKGASLRGANLEHLSLRLADLSGADLSLARLSRADLSGADLSGSHLMGVDLTEAVLNNANMAKASVLPIIPSGCALTSAQIPVGPLTLIQWFMLDAFPHANFTKSNLNGANLEGANLSFAILKEANLTRANLTGANMGETDLTNASLRLTEMTGSVLFGTNLQATVFEPKSLPDINMLALSENLEFVTYERLPAPLYGLRRQLQDGGFREQERQITYAIMSTQAQYHKRTCSSNSIQDCLEYAFNTVLFDWYPRCPDSGLFR